METRRCTLGVLIALSVFVQAYSIFVPDIGPPPKPGQCPRYLFNFPSRLGCSSDQDCHGDNKCCTYRCGSACVAPVYIKALCPDSTGTGTCDDLCHDDDDCLNGKKCCYNGCGHECMPPKIVKPGHCGIIPFHPCGNSCYHDGYCAGEEKCCPSFCGHFCKKPI
ncbi:WAP four-disulfide core domain protein 2 [Austrofundulus limnaeus]|uniref:WAP four-disulfide core domain protein 2 n=1 Tax=Austrofundulus limnaeus TaxID=52670 RepID=A0A2I4C066_AUSLI|nr:PREDICTED: WAP four-disulfide core domain protein 2-like [Austrofundulus limnaeus]